MRQRIVCFGELLLRLGAPERERLLQSPRLDVHVGGAEANVAVALARLGHAAAMVSVVPDNPLGAAAVGELRRHGVDTAGVAVGEGRMGLYFLETGALQRPSRVVYDRAHSAFARAAPARFDWDALLAGADALHLSGVTPALGADCAQAAIDAARAARARGLTVSFDGNFRASLWAAWDGVPRAILSALMAEADIVFADHRDIGIALGTEFPQPSFPERIAAAAEAAFAAFPYLARLACTLRAQHSVDRHALSALMLARDGTRHATPTQELAAIVDRIGTGDAFAAGVLHGLRSAMDDDASLRYGLAAACLKHSIPGDFGLLDAREIADFVAHGRLDVRR